MITDVQLSDKSATPVSQTQTANVQQGTATTVQQHVAEESGWRLYRTRVASTAVKVNLDFLEAKPPCEQGLLRSLSGCSSLGHAKTLWEILSHNRPRRAPMEKQIGIIFLGTLAILVLATGLTIAQEKPQAQGETSPREVVSVSGEWWGEWRQEPSYSGRLWMRLSKHGEGTQ